MNYFSGFCLQDESELFCEFIDKSEFCVSGFSLGAIEALEYVIKSEGRVDKLQLFSPAFFQDKDEKFKRLQLIHFQKDQDKYIENFISNIKYPSSLDINRYFHKSSINSLKKLLEYNYKISDLQNLQSRGVLIEVYIGDEDKIVDKKVVAEFFKPFAKIVLLKNRGHILNG